MPSSTIRRYLRHGMLPQLRAFDACARLGSLTRAAAELHIAQPTASVQIKKLAATLGVPLFEQVGRRVYLTAAGQRVHEGCQEVFRAFTSLEEALAAMQSLERGRLRLAVSSSAKHFAPRLLGAFMQRHPCVDVAMETYNGSTLRERLARNEDDLYLFTSPLARDHVVTQALLTNSLVVFARDDHPLAAESRIALQRLAAEPFLMREAGSGTRELVTRLFAQRGLVPRMRLELSTDEAIREAILAGVGVSILSRFTFGLEPEAGRLVCLDVEGFPFENRWYFAYPAGKQLSPPARAFLDLARREAKRLAEQSARGRLT